MTVNMHAILVGLLSVSHTPEQADHAARSVLEQHAHELAEQQRATGRDTYCSGVNCCQEHGGVADLIDPQAQRATTEGDTL